MRCFRCETASALRASGGAAADGLRGATTCCAVASADHLPANKPHLQRVIEQGRLTPKVLDLFERTQHEAVTERVAALGIRRWTPPLLPTTRDGPLGFSKPAWQ